jgi:class 3 adenylate cyclase/tetratricopeptide (TPR) repeat protein
MRPVSPLHFGPFHLEGTDDGLWHGAQRCKLKAKACAVLRYLVEHPGRLVRKTDLLTAVWPDVHVSDWVLTTCIREIRHVLGESAKTPRYIATVHRQGYRFIAPVTRTNTPPALSVSEAPPLPLRSAAPAHAAPPSAPMAVALEEEHKLVTILCGALAEAPALAARLGPERWYRLLQTVVGLTQDVLQHYAGTLTLATSDGFTAVFGAPVAQEDHARRAVLAALELRQRLRDAPTLHAQLTGSVLAIGMGLHSGLVVVGTLGDDPQRIYTTVGVPLHLATCLQQQAAPETILLSAATYALVHAEVQVEPYGTLTVDGQSTPVSMYAVQGPLRRHAGVVGRGSRALSPFVGRERELALLHDHLAVARGGQGQVVGLVGAPGMGKTRLLTEFFRRVPGDQVAVYEGRCLSYGQGTPYLPVRDLVRQVCGLVEGDEPAVHTVAVQQRLHASGMTAEDDMAPLLQLLDLPVAPECLARRSPETRQARTFALLRHLVLDAAQRQPLVLVVENLHWSDPASEAWLASLVERLPEAAVLLLGTYRPGYQPAWGVHAAVTQVAVPPLRAQDARKVVQAVLGAVFLPEAQLRTIVAQAGGNPFFLEELAWHAVEQGGRDTPGAVPETVHAVLAARLDRLPSEVKRLLQTAAVIGAEVPVPLLQALAERSAHALHHDLASLQAAEFLYETRLFPDHAYTFKHALTQEVVYSSLLQEQRRSLHAQIAEALEVLAGDRLAEQVERLAHHALRGEVWDTALVYCRQAGEKALARSAYREAVGYFEQALSALAYLPARRDTREQAIDLRLALRAALHPAGIMGRAMALLREAEALATALDDPRRLCQVSVALALHDYLTGTYDQAIAAGQRALVLATASGEVVLQALANHYLGMAYYAQGAYRQAIDCFGQTVASLDGAQRHEHFGQSVLPAVFSRAWLARCHAELGTFAVGNALAAEGLQIAEAVAYPASFMFALWGVGLVRLLQGDLPRALPPLERAVGLYQEKDRPAWFPSVATALGAAYTLSGRLADALPLLTQAVEQSTVMEAVVDQACYYLALGEAQLLAGHLEEAWTLAERALVFSHAHQEGGHQAYALRLLGDIAARREPPEVVQAEAHYQQALALAEKLGMRPLVAHCHHGLGTLYSTAGWREQARAALSTAIEMYRAMAMAWWLPQAEAVLAQIGKVETPSAYGAQPEHRSSD